MKRTKTSIKVLVGVLALTGAAVAYDYNEI